MFPFKVNNGAVGVIQHYCHVLIYHAKVHSRCTIIQDDKVVSAFVFILFLSCLFPKKWSLLDVSGK